MPESIEYAHRKCKKVIHTKNKTELQNTRTHSILFWTGEMLLKFIIGIYFFSCRRWFLSFYLKVKVVENLISSGIEDHTFGPINLREHFPEEELTVGKNRFLEVASLVEW